MCVWISPSSTSRREGVSSMKSGRVCHTHDDRAPTNKPSTNEYYYSQRNEWGFSVLLVLQPSVAMTSVLQDLKSSRRESAGCSWAETRICSLPALPRRHTRGHAVNGSRFARLTLWKDEHRAQLRQAPASWFMLRPVQSLIRLGSNQYSSCHIPQHAAVVIIPE